MDKASMAAATIESVIETIRADRRSGASQLADQCLAAVKEFAQQWAGSDAALFRAEMLELVTRLQQTRTSMVVIDNLLGRWRDGFEQIEPSQVEPLRKAAMDHADGLRVDLNVAFEGAVAHMAALIAKGEVVMTHSLSSTIKALFAAVAGRGIEAIITESRPLEEGRLLAQHLSELNIPTRYITDAQMGLWVPRADRVVVGADAILGDGSVVNKAGTLLLAMAAHAEGVPVQVCCESFKQSSKRSDEIVLEEMSGDELDIDPPPGVTVANTYFDVTPARYISAWVSEKGVVADWG